jgi:hypothetical protein
MDSQQLPTGYPSDIPHRVQLKRTKAWRMPANTVKVTRPGKWGNPFRVGGWFCVGDPGIAKIPFRMSWCETSIPGERGFSLIEDADMAVDFYQRLLANGYRSQSDFETLRGKNLACWCPIGTPCHADILLRLANQGAP